MIRRIRGAVTKSVLDRLDHLAQENPETFQTFYTQFGAMLKEGIVVDPMNKERIAKLLRFASSRGQDASPTVSLDDYIARMPEGQKRIYYLGGPDFASIAKSPNLEIFRRRGVEVLFLTDPIDEFAITSLRSYQGKELTFDRFGRPRPARDGRDRRGREEARRTPGQGERLRPCPRPVPLRARGSSPRGPGIETADR